MGRSKHQNIVSVKTKPGALPPEAFDRIPRAQVTFTDETAWLTRFDERGKPMVTYPVHMADVAAAFRFLGTTTGLLPADTLFCSQKGETARIGIYLPPQVRALTFDLGKKKNTVLRVPLPGLVFVGERMHYSVFAVDKRPVDENARLYHAPLSNVSQSGLICAGTVKFPSCTAGTIHAAAALFFESAFNHDLSDGKITRVEADQEDEEMTEELYLSRRDRQRRRADRSDRETQSLFQFLTSLQSLKAFPPDRLAPSNVRLSHLVRGANHE